MRYSFIICLGSNFEDGKSRIQEALQRLADYISINVSSEIYVTECELATNKKIDSYHNCVVNCSSELTFKELNASIKQLEIDMGRTIEEREKGNVPIDIDIVEYNGKIIREKDYERDYFQVGYKMINKKKRP